MSPLPDVPQTPSPDDESLAAWLRLVHTPGIGAVTGQLLLRRLGPPEAILQASYATVRALVRSDEAARALLADDPVREQDIQAALSWLHAGNDRHILALDDPRYPAALLDLPDAPLLVYARGSLAALQPAAVAIVGSRRASHEGLRNAQALAEALARRGIIVTSGLAEGIDAAAHQGALEGAPAGQASTIAVTGAGIDRIYPAHHLPLARRVLEQGGLVLSEQPLGSAPMRANFPRRNRMIAALSRGTLVVEAALRSGSLITARQAAELGREVMAVPGSIHNPLSHGCHHLIRDGATLIETVDDILQALGMVSPGQDASDQETIRGGRIRARQRTARRASGRREWQSIIADQESGAVEQTPSRPEPPDDAEPPDDDSRDLLTILSASPMSAEALASRLGWPIDRILITIQLLELGGYIGRHVDGRWQRLDGHQEALSGNPRLA